MIKEWRSAKRSGNPSGKVVVQVTLQDTDNNSTVKYEEQTYLSQIPDGVELARQGAWKMLRELNSVSRKPL